MNWFFYGTKVYKGIAIKVETDSTNTAQNIDKKSPFIKKCEEQNAQQKKQKEHLKTAGILAGVVGFITLLVILMSK